MKKPITLFILIIISISLEAQYPRLDPEFNEVGFVDLPGFIPDFMELQPDNKIYLENYKYIPGEPFPDRSAIMVDHDGKIEGQVELKPGGQRQSNGKLVTAYTKIENDQSILLVSRLNQDGSLDLTFGNDGEVLVNNAIPFRWDGKEKVQNNLGLTILPNDKILLSGTSSIPTPDDNGGYISTAYSFVRLNSDGSFDETFGENGRVLFPVEEENRLIRFMSRIAIQGENIIMVGDVNDPDFVDAETFRIRYDGSFDSTFYQGPNHIGPRGIVDMKIQQDGKILISSTAGGYVGFPLFGSVKRYNANGTPDESFKYNLYQVEITSDPKLKIQEDGKILLGTEEVLGRLNADGSPDLEFGNKGFLNIPARNFILQPDNKVLVALSNNQAGQIRRYLINPDPDPEKLVINRIAPINALTDTEIYTMQDRQVINFYHIETKEINLRAVTNPEVAESVKFTLSGTQNYTHIENVEPYALFKNEGQNYFSWKPALGNYVLTATPYSEPNGEGEAGLPLILSFSVVNEEIPKIEKFVLVNAMTDEELFDIKWGSVIDLNEIGTQEINIRAYTIPKVTGSVSFFLEDFFSPKYYRHIENVEPYALFKNDGDDFFSWKPEEDNSKLLTAHAHSKPNISGNLSKAYTILFSIINSQSQKDLNAFNLYPNPGTDNINFSFGNLKEEKMQILIYDLAGNVALSQENIGVHNGAFSLKTSELKSRPYIIKVVSEQEVKIFRWVKE